MCPKGCLMPGGLQHKGDMKQEFPADTSRLWGIVTSI